MNDLNSDVHTKRKMFNIILSKMELPLDVKKI